MPAAAVIPAPTVYIKVVAVKKLVVGFLPRPAGPPLGPFDLLGRKSEGTTQNELYHRFFARKSVKRTKGPSRAQLVLSCAPPPLPPSKGDPKSTP